MSTTGNRLFYITTPLALALSLATYTVGISNCTLDGCPSDRYCNTTTGFCEFCRDHADDCLTVQQQPQCNQVCFKLMLKQSKETKKCSAPPTLENGSYSGRRTNQPQQYGDEVTIRCDMGYHVNGPAENVCGSYGCWKNQFSSCDVNTCKLMPNVVNGKVTLPENKTTLSYGDIIYYKCDNGYDLIGSSVLLCAEHGEWNTSAPSCLRKMCSLPKPIPNGHYNATTNVVFGNVIEISCMENFRLEGNAYLTCRADGNWDRQLPVCKAVECSEPPRLINGYYRGKTERYLVRSAVMYVCYRGYELREQQYRLWTCKENGMWDKNTVPVCEEEKPKEVRCDMPTQPLHGRNDATRESRPGETVEFTCEDGYQLTGDAILTCLNEGLWDNTFPYCNKTVCNQPIEIRNGGIVETERSEFPVDTSVHYVCNEGYYASDKEYSVWTCTKKGSWDKLKSPTCKKLQTTCEVPKDCHCDYKWTVIIVLVSILLIVVLGAVIAHLCGLDKKIINMIVKNYNIHCEHCERVNFGNSSEDSRLTDKASDQDH